MSSAPNPTNMQGSFVTPEIKQPLFQCCSYHLIFTRGNQTHWHWLLPVRIISTAVLRRFTWNSGPLASVRLTLQYEWLRLQLLSASLCQQEVLLCNKNTPLASLDDTYVHPSTVVSASNTGQSHMVLERHKRDTQLRVLTGILPKCAWQIFCGSSSH